MTTKINWKEVSKGKIDWEKVLEASVKLGIDPYQIGEVFNISPNYSPQISISDALDQGDLILASRLLNQLSPEKHSLFNKKIQEKYRKRIKEARKNNDEHALWGILNTFPPEKDDYNSIATFLLRIILEISASKGTIVQSWDVFKHPRANYTIRSKALFCILNISHDKKDLPTMWNVFRKSLKHHPVIALEALSVILSLSIQESNVIMACKVYQQILSKFKDKSYESRKPENNIRIKALLAINIMIGRALSSRDDTILNVFTYHNLPKGKSKEDVLRYLVTKALTEK